MAVKKIIIHRFVMYAPGLVTDKRTSQPWFLSKCRKPHQCCLCLKAIETGENAYRPLTHAKNRMKRIHESCVMDDCADLTI